MFGQNIADKAEAAVKELWRVNPPVLWSQRPPGERDQTLWVWIYGLCGLTAESAADGWASCLTPDQARIAAAYAAVEINGFPAWLNDLAAAHPSEVSAVLGGEIAAELALGAGSPFLSTLQHLTHAAQGIKRLFVPQLLAEVRGRTWTAPDDPARSHWVQHLTAALQVLDEVAEESEKIALAAECERRFLADPAASAAPVWLRQLFRLDSRRAAEVLDGGLASLPGHDRATRALTLFAGLFGNREGVLLRFPDEAARAAVLGRLVRCAYRYIRPEDDRRHDGPFTPDTRDNAETARGFLLSALLDAPGPEAHRARLDLAADPMFAHFSDRPRLLARQRAAADAEGEPLAPAAVVVLNERYEAPPNDRNSLFEVMVDRLDDLQQELSHDDFTNRRTLRSITDETEMQRYLAGRLRETAKGAYIVTREEEVADRKEPDIRLITSGGSHKAAIEVKIASSWSLAELERALRNQLVGQYLRDESCKVGCLLLTCEGKKKFWEQVETGARLDFGGLIRHLAERGRELELQQSSAFRLAVRGLDLRDPQLAAAHRSPKAGTRKSVGRKRGPISPTRTRPHQPPCPK